MAEPESSPLLGTNGEQEKKLCQQCEKLDLRVDRFIIGSGFRPTARNPENYEITKPQDGSVFQLRSGETRFNKAFANLALLQLNSSFCNLCDLIRRGIKKYSHGRSDSETTCHVQWEVDGHEIDRKASSVNRTRRIRLTWTESTGHTQEAYLALVSVSEGEPLNSEGMTRQIKPIRFLGREYEDQRECYALIKGWLKVCSNEHLDCCGDGYTSANAFKQLVHESYFGVIDVTDMQLKALPVDRSGVPHRFVALSYVWGRNQNPYQTTRANIMKHIYFGGLEPSTKKLSRTIQDTFSLVRRLGERYLWIDSLCIVQDSQLSWQLNAKVMHLVYGNAYFTICAADGDASTGLRALHRVDDNFLSHGKSLELNGAVDRAPHLSLASSNAPITAQCAPGIRLMMTRPLELVLNDSEWNRRGWTFQERILSRRCVVFAEGRAYFQCRSIGISQDIHTDDRGDGWSLDQVNSPFRTLRSLHQKPISLYMQYVGMYTKRQLTKANDVLAAFEGISWLLNQYMSSRSLFGIPVSHFDLALLWMPYQGMDLRKTEASALEIEQNCSHDPAENCSCKRRTSEFQDDSFPSWSWCGWMGGGVEYPSDMLEGCLLNVRDWLKCHTWIQWHIRDGNGHLQPLHHIKAERKRSYSERAEERVTSGQPENSEDHERWSGYPEARPNAVTQKGEEFEQKASRRLHVDEWDDEDVMPNSRRAARSRVPIPLKEQRSRSNFSAPPYPIDEDATMTRIRLGLLNPPANGNLPREPSDRGPSKSAWPIYESAEHWQGEVEGHDKSERAVKTAAEDTELLGRDPMSEDKQLQSWESGRRHFVDPDRRMIAETGNRDQKISKVHIQIPDNNDQDYERTENIAYLKSRSRSVFREDSLEARKDYLGDRIDWQEDRPASAYPDGKWEDDLGRTISSDIPSRNPRFHAILPDNPFSVIRQKSASEDSNAEYQPILQFWTWRTELHVLARENEPHAQARRLGAGLCHCDIADKMGDWCGSIVLNESWIRDRDGGLVQFIAISEAKAFSTAECPSWTYYIPKERDESEWDLYYVLLIERNPRRELWERVGLGKVFQVSFREKTWDEIKLEYWLIHAITTAALIVLQDLEHGSAETETIIQACQSLHEMTKTLPLAADCLSTINGAFKRSKLQLPVYVHKYFGEARHRKDGLMHHAIAALMPPQDSASLGSGVDNTWGPVISRSTQ